MSGHMRKRGANSWQLIVFNGFDSRGRRQYSRKTVHGTRKEAELSSPSTYWRLVTGQPHRGRGGDAYPGARWLVGVSWTAVVAGDGRIGTGSR